jgi:hypothetical protein
MTAYLTTNIELTVNNRQAAVNGNAEPADAAEVINSKIYVPVRFIAEAANAEVQYITNINKLAQTDGTIYDGISYNEYVNNVKAVVIETNSAAAPVYTVDDGLKAIKSESEKAYKEVTDYLESQGGGFNDTQKD